MLAPFWRWWREAHPSGDGRRASFAFTYPRSSRSRQSPEGSSAARSRGTNLHDARSPLCGPAVVHTPAKCMRVARVLRARSCGRGRERQRRLLGPSGRRRWLASSRRSSATASGRCPSSLGAASLFEPLAGDARADERQRDELFAGELSEIVGSQVAVERMSGPELLPLCSDCHPNGIPLGPRPHPEQTAEQPGLAALRLESPNTGEDRAASALENGRPHPARRLGHRNT